MDKDYTEKTKTVAKQAKEETWVVVEGKIRGKERPRVVQGHAFTPKQTMVYEKRVRSCYQEQCGRYFTGAVGAYIDVYCKIPQSYSKKRTQAILEGKELPMKKPDLDNVAKIILDSLNGIAFNDDTQVVILSLMRLYTDGQERVEFKLEEVFR